MNKRFFHNLMIILCLVSTGVTWASPTQKATYSISVNGLPLANINGELTKQATNYRLTVNTGLDIPQLALSGFGQSDGVIDNDYPKPHRFIEDSQFPTENNHRELKFNWQQSTVTNSQTNTPLTIPADTQDMLSCYLAIQQDLKLKRSPLSCNITDGHKVRKYNFSQHGREMLETKLGLLETVVIQYQHKKRSVRFWLAPKYDYLIVHAEYLLNEQWEITAKLVSYE